jgi:hypothetical protein
MRFSFKHKAFVLCIGAALFVMGGCATATRLPIKLEPSFFEMKPQKIALLPIVYRGKGELDEVRWEFYYRTPVSDETKKVLEKKGYFVILLKTFAEGKQVKMRQVAEMGLNDTILLGPDDAGYIILLYFDNITERVEDIPQVPNTRLCTFGVTITGTLISKRRQSELWRDVITREEKSRIQRYPRSGVTELQLSAMELLLIRQTIESNVKNAVNDLLMTLPKCIK